MSDELPVNVASPLPVVSMKELNSVLLGLIREPGAVTSANPNPSVTKRRPVRSVAVESAWGVVREILCGRDAVTTTAAVRVTHREDERWFRLLDKQTRQRK